MKNCIWFRNDLRIADNASLIKACQGESVIAVYFFDPRHYAMGDFGFKKTEKYRGRFLIETMTELKDNLENLNIPLYVFMDTPENVFPDLVQKYDIKTIYLQKEWTREETHILDALVANLPAATKFVETYDQFLFHPEDIPFEQFSDIPKVYTHFRKICEKNAEVRAVIDSPKPMPTQNLKDNTTEIPNLNALGLDNFETDSRTAFPFKGGEQQALQRVQGYFWNTEKLASYKKTRNGLIGTDYSSKLSAWLANGSISPRTVYREVKDFEKQVNKNDSTYWLIFELIWRDYFKYVSLKHGSKIFQIGGILEKEYSWDNSDKAKDN
ncbi:deoxyribodipyrimidine photo-lyase [Pricia sp. S334]|uniref:Deoxyribodipyrimidine photo-lyase n=1 Tax=Pricia mediterranea TaxID=3076079 RepID=A0ABU3L7B1_9FLAO|nr:deoxyribodipyrimidine photo-lyase [Pricia sp. S334]MDT7829631.1 deoxyribodipyrimidine photo-lyase [Pricia sp. S334]